MNAKAIKEKKKEWWIDQAFVATLEKDLNAWESGKEKGYSLKKIKADITKKKGSQPEARLPLMRYAENNVCLTSCSIN